MKRISSIVFAGVLFLSVSSFLFITACQKQDNVVTPVSTTTTSAVSNAKTGFANLARTTEDNGYSQPISKDTANMMIQSYLNSVGYPAVDDKIRSFSYDAGVLMSYLTDPTHDKIVSVKFMIAHTTDYIHNGNYGVYAGLAPGALTLVIVGVGAEGQYVFSNGVSVLDRMQPCPSVCGNPSGPTL